MLGMTLVLSLAAIVLARVSSSKSVATATSAKPRIEQLHALVREGIGSEVSLARAGARPDEVRNSVDSVKNFIQQRSGLEMSEAVESRLATMERDTLDGASKRITPDELSDVLTQTLLERIHNLNDAEITHAADALRGFDAPDLPAEVKATRNSVMLRANGKGSMPANVFIDRAREFRERTFIPQLLLSFMGLARSEVSKVVQNRLENLSAALPEQWGQATRDGLTPLQAYLITYSATSDDYLWYSQQNLQGLMKSSEQIQTQVYGHYSSAEGWRAYGVNGYMYSTPLDLVFDQRTTTRLLDRLEQRSRK